MPGDNQTEILIRESRPEDINDIISLLQQLWPGRDLNIAALKDSFLKSFGLSGHFIRIASYRDHVVGLCSLSIRNNLKAGGNLANIDELVVDENMRGMRIGRILLEDAQIIAANNHCRSIGLESSFHRKEAHSFYEKNGFGKTGYFILKDLY